MIFFPENLAAKQEATVTQSSTHMSQGPDLANNKQHDDTTYGQCSHTAVNHSLAWLQVDLGGKRSIKSVKIYYRDEGT